MRKLWVREAESPSQLFWNGAGIQILVVGLWSLRFFQYPTLIASKLRQSLSIKGELTQKDLQTL